MRVFIAILLAISSAPAFAGGKLKGLKPDLSIEYQDDVFEVQPDGSYVATLTHRFKVQTEEGKRRAALTKIGFDPEKQTVTVKFAKTTTLGKDFPLDLKTVENREIGSVENGISNRRTLILPFRALAIDSTVEYTVVMKSKPNSIPGVFSLTEIFGTELPEVAGRAVVKSKKPLNFKLRDRDKSLLVTKEGKEGWYTVTIEIKKPIFLDIHGEESPYISGDMVPRVDISNTATWQEIAGPLAAKYDAEVSQPLPPEFAQIAAEAATAPTDEAKFNSVMTALASKMTYVGHWTAEKGRLFPRGHKEVVSTKTGDCKDFSTSTAGILRTLGYDAKVALTYRTSPGLRALNEPALEDGESAPSTDYFNHAIVAVRMKDGTTKWLDPTSISPQAERVSADIANAYALVLDAKSQKLELIPEGAPPISRMDYNYRVIVGETADVKGSVELGGGDAQLLRLLMKESNEQGDMVLRALISGNPKASGTFQPTNADPSAFKANFQFAMEKAIVKDEGERYLRMPRYLGFNMFAFAKWGRKVPLYIGGKSQTNLIFNVTGADTWDDETSDCLVLSEWFDYKRVVSPIKGGFEIRNEAKIKTDHLTPEDMQNEHLYLALSSLRSCGSAVQLKGSDESKHKVTSSNMTIDEAWALTEGVNRQKFPAQLRAIRVFDRLLSQNKLDHRARIGRAKALFNYGYLSGREYKTEYLTQAISELDFVLKEEPNSIEGLATRSRIKMRNHQLFTAVQDFAAVRKLAPWDYKVLILAADLSEARRDNAAAEIWYQHAIRAGNTPEQVAEAKFSLAWFFSKEKQPEKAIKAREEALAIKGDDAWQWHNIAIDYSSVRRFDDAIAAEKKALAISDFGAARWGLANYYCESVNRAMDSGGITFFAKPEYYAKAEADLDNGLKAQDGHIYCLNTAAEFNLRKTAFVKDPALFDRAEGYTRKALSVEPTDKTALSTLKVIEGRRNPGVFRVPAGQAPRSGKEMMELFKSLPPGTRLEIEMGKKK